MVTIKSKREIELMREAGRVVAIVYDELEKHIKPGITTLELDEIAELEKQGKALVLRPHKDLGVTRYTTDPEKLGPWFQLGYDETLERMDQIKEFIK